MKLTLIHYRGDIWEFDLLVGVRGSLQMQVADTVKQVCQRFEEDEVDWNRARPTPSETDQDYLDSFIPAMRLEIYANLRNLGFAPKPFAEFTIK